MIGKYNKSVILTYIGAALSIFGMVLAVNGNLAFSFICLIYAGICDLFDGVIARKCKRTEEEKAFGVQIDSLTDMISFIAFPCVIGMKLMKDVGMFVVPVFAFYTICGIIRLAWFNIHTNAEGKTKYYDGLPVTYAALILPVFYVCMKLLKVSFLSWITMLLYIIIAFLFIMKVKIRKPSGIWYGIFGVLAIAVTVLILIMP